MKLARTLEDIWKPSSGPGDAVCGDERGIRGTRLAGRLVPARHTWRIEAGCNNARRPDVKQQISFQVMPRDCWRRAAVACTSLASAPAPGDPRRLPCR